MEPFVLANESVRLSVPTVRDIDAIMLACQDSAIADWTVVPSPYRREDAEVFVQRFVPEGWSRGSAYNWAVREAGTADGPLLGMVGVHFEGRAGSPDHEQCAELGFWTAPAARGKGLATEAGRLVVDWAFDPEGLGLAVLQWVAYTGNWPSRRVAWNLGFRVEGTIRRYGLQRGRRRDAWVGTLLPGDPREPNEEWTGPSEAHRSFG
ncbi:GNAT family protein [Myceligenerans crystallogenes]|uniref:GNAT family N-acetyltransferase n=1 Tax=Myceligenerans crystallogenes TaxID=316335 RepID=A0ABN2N766_9MICO